jgi:hypothetical protein
MQTLSGGCLCGAVRYEIDIADEQASTCHCTMCRRQSGGAFLAFVTVARSRYRLDRGTIKRHRSSALAQRGFCPDCGTPLLFEYDFEPDRVGVITASLDDPESVPPVEHWGAESMLSWLKLDDGLPRRTTDEDPELEDALRLAGRDGL